MKAVALLAGLAAVTLPVAALAEEFHLACNGITSGVSQATTFSNASVDFGGPSASGTATTYRRSEAADRLLIEADDAGARIKVPPTMMPVIAGGGKDGWWPIKNWTVTDTELAGKFTINPVNQPRVRVDRRTGDIQISGFGGGFRGTCERFEADPAARKF